VAQVVYIGGEATAAGFRLAGVDARVAAPGDAAAMLRQAFTERPDCVLLDGTLVDYVPAVELERALVALSPLFAVVPDIRGRGAPPDLTRTVRNALGID
jgi:vacuolar-type H+-ATPase subunit F/Vma7